MSAEKSELSQPTSLHRPWLIVSGDFVETGGMDVANMKLAEYLVARCVEVHLVAHRVSGEL